MTKRKVNLLIIFMLILCSASFLISCSKNKKSNNMINDKIILAETNNEVNISDDSINNNSSNETKENSNAANLESDLDTFDGTSSVDTKVKSEGAIGNLTNDTIDNKNNDKSLNNDKISNNKNQNTVPALQDNKPVNTQINSEKIIKVTKKMSSKNPTILFIQSTSMKDAKVSEFYDYLQLESNTYNVYTVYTDDLKKIAKNQDIQSLLLVADKIIVLGVPMKTSRDYKEDNWLKYPDLDYLRGQSKDDAKWYYVYALNSVSYFDWFNIISNYRDIVAISATYPWESLYTGNVFDKNDDLGIEGKGAIPTNIAGYGLSVYLQYIINNNLCSDQSYNDLIYRMNIDSTLTKMQSDKLETVRKQITKEENSNLVSKNNLKDTELIEVQEAFEVTNTSVFKENRYDIFKDMYLINSGINKLNQETDRNPICFDGGFNDLLIERIWEKDHWIHNDKKIEQDPLDHSNSEGNSITIEKDVYGNYYIGKIIEDKYYILTYDIKGKLNSRLCVSDLVDGYVDKFYLYQEGKIIVQTFQIADKYSMLDCEHYNHVYRSDKVLLIDLISGKLIKSYEAGYSIGEISGINNGDIYTMDETNTNLIILDGESGIINKIIDFTNFPYITETNAYSEEFGNDITYRFSIYKDDIYLLKKSGIYKINMNNGRWMQIVGGKDYQFIKLQDMRFTDFVVTNEKEMYVLAVNYDNECSTDLFQYLAE